MNNQLQYIRTQQGDTFDLIAYRLYGETRGITEQIVAVNPQITRKTPVFDAGILIYLPNVTVKKQTQPQTLWL